MYKNKVSIITVCYNAEMEIERTIQSVLSQTYDNFEYIIVDGNSKDKTISIINQYSGNINQIISEPDKGIYDAMNKGIKMANGEWVIMMNAGDVFASDDVLSRIFHNHIPENKEFIYSDSYIKNGNEWLVCPMDFDKGALNHQCVIYKKLLHDKIGYYIVTPQLIISDYLFFIQVPKEKVMKTATIIAKYEGGGASNKFPAKTHALCADVVFRRKSFSNLLITKFIQIIGDIVPISFKYRVKKIMFRNER